MTTVRGKRRCQSKVPSLLEARPADPPEPSSRAVVFSGIARRASWQRLFREIVMRRTWIGVAAAAGLTTVAGAAGFAAAQEKAPTGQQIERGQKHQGEGVERGERGQSSQSQSQSEERQRNNERTGQEKMGQQKMGDQPGKAAGEEGNAAQGAERSDERANQAQTEKIGGEKRAGEENRTNARDAQNNQENGSPAREGQPNRAGNAEKSRAEGTDRATGNESSPTEEKGRTAAEPQTPVNRTGQAETGRPGMQNGEARGAPLGAVLGLGEVEEDELYAALDLGGREGRWRRCAQRDVKEGCVL